MCRYVLSYVLMKVLTSFRLNCYGFMALLYLICIVLIKLHRLFGMVRYRIYAIQILGMELKVCFSVIGVLTTCDLDSSLKFAINLLIVQEM